MAEATLKVLKVDKGDVPWQSNWTIFKASCGMPMRA